MHTYDTISRLVTAIVVKVERLSGLAQLVPYPQLIVSGRQPEVRDDVTLLRKGLLRVGLQRNAGAAACGRDNDQPRSALLGSKWRLDSQAGGDALRPCCGDGHV